jgi:glycine cleavage system aminomethyltransferase T
VGNIAGLTDGRGCLSLVTNERGGIIDDTVITNAGDFVYMVVQVLRAPRSELQDHSSFINAERSSWKSERTDGDGAKKQVDALSVMGTLDGSCRRGAAPPRVYSRTYSP